MEIVRFKTLVVEIRIVVCKKFVGKTLGWERILEKVLLGDLGALEQVHEAT